MITNVMFTLRYPRHHGAAVYFLVVLERNSHYILTFTTQSNIKFADQIFFFAFAFSNELISFPINIECRSKSFVIAAFTVYIAFLSECFLNHSFN